jgi:hypothetical protein
MHEYGEKHVSLIANNLLAANDAGAAAELRDRLAAFVRAETSAPLADFVDHVRRLCARLDAMLKDASSRIVLAEEIRLYEGALRRAMDRLVELCLHGHVKGFGPHVADISNPAAAASGDDAVSPVEFRQNRAPGDAEAWPFHTRTLYDVIFTLQSLLDAAVADSAGRGATERKRLADRATVDQLLRIAASSFMTVRVADRNSRSVIGRSKLAMDKRYYPLRRSLKMLADAYGGHGYFVRRLANSAFGVYLLYDMLRLEDVSQMLEEEGPLKSAENMMKFIEAAKSGDAAVGAAASGEFDAFVAKKYAKLLVADGGGGNGDEPVAMNARHLMALAFQMRMGVWQASPERTELRVETADPTGDAQLPHGVAAIIHRSNMCRDVVERMLSSLSRARALRKAAESSPDRSHLNDAVRRHFDAAGDRFDVSGIYDVSERKKGEPYANRAKQVFATFKQLSEILHGQLRAKGLVTSDVADMAALFVEQVSQRLDAVNVVPASLSLSAGLPEKNLASVLFARADIIDIHAGLELCLLTTRQWDEMYRECKSWLLERAPSASSSSSAAAATPEQVAFVLASMAVAEHMRTPVGMTFEIQRALADCIVRPGDVFMMDRFLTSEEGSVARQRIADAWEALMPVALRRSAGKGDAFVHIPKQAADVLAKSRPAVGKIPPRVSGEDGFNFVETAQEVSRTLTVQVLTFAAINRLLRDRCSVKSAGSDADAEEQRMLVSDAVGAFLWHYKASFERWIRSTTAKYKKADSAAVQLDDIAENYHRLMALLDDFEDASRDVRHLTLVGEGAGVQGQQADETGTLRESFTKLLRAGLNVVLERVLIVVLERHSSANAVSIGKIMDKMAEKYEQEYRMASQNVQVSAVAASAEAVAADAGSDSVLKAFYNTLAKAVGALKWQANPTETAESHLRRRAVERIQTFWERAYTRAKTAQLEGLDGNGSAIPRYDPHWNVPAAYAPTGDATSAISGATARHVLSAALRPPDGTQDADGFWSWSTNAAVAHYLHLACETWHALKPANRPDMGAFLARHVAGTIMRAHETASKHISGFAKNVWWFAENTADLYGPDGVARLGREVVANLGSLDFIFPWELREEPALKLATSFAIMVAHGLISNERDPVTTKGLDSAKESSEALRAHQPQVYCLSSAISCLCDLFRAGTRPNAMYNKLVKMMPSSPDALPAEKAQKLAVYIESSSSTEDAKRDIVAMYKALKQKTA